LPPLDRATRRPASAVTSSSLPTTAIRSPPPALEQARAGATWARGSRSTSWRRHASYPSSTSVSIGVRCSAAAAIRPSASDTSEALVNVEPKSTQTTTSSAEGTVEVREEVVDALDADTEPDQIVGDLELRAGDAHVGHPARVLDQALHPAERLPEREHLRACAGVDRRVSPVGVPEAHHAPESLHLPRGDLVPGVLGQPGEEHLADLGVPKEELDDLLGVVAVSVHPDAERLEAAMGEEAVERTRHRTHGVLMEGDRLGQVEVTHNHST